MINLPPPPEPGESDRLHDLMRSVPGVRPDAVTLARLERFWRVESQRRARRAWLRATAAAALLMITAGLLFLRAVPGRPGLAASAPAEQPPTEPSQRVTKPAHAAPAGRSPTPYEIAAFYTQAPRSGNARLALLEDDKEGLEERVASLIVDASPDAASEFASLRPKEEAYACLRNRLDKAAVVPLLVSLAEIKSERDRAESLMDQLDPAVVDSLFDDLSTKNASDRHRAALILARINGPRITHRLIDTVSNDARNKEAWLALSRCRGELAHDFLSYASQQPRLMGYLNAARVRWPSVL